MLWTFIVILMILTYFLRNRRLNKIIKIIFLVFSGDTWAFALVKIGAASWNSSRIFKFLSYSQTGIENSTVVLCSSKCICLFLIVLGWFQLTWNLWRINASSNLPRGFQVITKIFMRKIHLWSIYLLWSETAYIYSHPASSVFDYTVSQAITCAYFS